MTQVSRHNPTHVSRLGPCDLGHVPRDGWMDGCAALEARVGVHDPAHSGAVAKGRSRGGQAAADMADVRSLQKEQEARGGPVVGSRKRTAVQRMNL